MLGLRDMQREFVDFALGETGQAGTDLRCCLAQDGSSVHDRLSVYRHNAQIGFAKALQATFPALLRLSGEGWFNQTAESYQRVHPSRSGDLNAVGAEFAQFLAQSLRGGDYDYFIDVATLEWTYCNALNERAPETVEFDGLGELTDQQWLHLRLLVNPTAHLIESEFPLFDIWNRHRSDSADEAVIHLSQGASRILLVRRTDHVEVRELPPTTFALLRAFASGAAVCACVDSVIQAMGEFDLADALRRLIELRALVGFRLASGGEALVN